MAKWQNRMTKMIKPTVGNTKDSSNEIVEELDTLQPIDSAPETEVNPETTSIELDEETPTIDTLDTESVEPEVVDEAEVKPEPEVIAEPEVVNEPEVEPEPTPIIPRTIETSVINAGTRITGNIESDDILIFHAHINGNIKCTQKLTAYETINGDVVADSVEYHKVSQTGNITVKNDCLIADEITAITGDITCTDITCNGIVNGNINCAGACYVEETANITGDIHANQLSIKPGAIIKGKISMNNSLNNN